MISKQKIIELEIGGEKKSFTSNAWSPMKCFSHLPKIGKAFAVPLSMLMSGDEDNFGEILPQVLFMLFEQMEEENVWELFQLIVEDVHFDATRKIDLDNDLDCDLGAIVGLIGEVLQQNYGSLFSGNGLRSLMTSLTGVTQVAAV